MELIKDWISFPNNVNKLVLNGKSTNGDNLFVVLNRFSDGFECYMASKNSSYIFAPSFPIILTINPLILLPMPNCEQPNTWRAEDIALNCSYNSTIKPLLTQFFSDIPSRFRIITSKYLIGQYEILNILREVPQFFQIVISNPALAFLCAFPFQNLNQKYNLKEVIDFNKRAVVMRRNQILELIQMTNTKSFIKLLRKIPKKDISLVYLQMFESIYHTDEKFFKHYPGHFISREIIYCKKYYSRVFSNAFLYEVIENGIEIVDEFSRINKVLKMIKMDSPQFSSLKQYLAFKERLLERLIPNHYYKSDLKDEIIFPSPFLKGIDENLFQPIKNSYQASLISLMLNNCIHETSVIKKIFESNGRYYLYTYQYKLEEKYYIAVVETNVNRDELNLIALGKNNCNLSADTLMQIGKYFAGVFKNKYKVIINDLKI